MSLVCANSSECCPDKIWPDFVMPAKLSDQLKGLLWLMPITNFLPPWNIRESAGNCVNPPNDVTVLKGFAGQLYTATLLIRGVVEQGRYVGGTLIPGNRELCVLNPTSVINDGHNIYKLEISDPHQVYYLNRWQSVSPDQPDEAYKNDFPSYYACYAIRYVFDVQIYGGATVTLSADAVNGGEVTNFAQKVVPLTAGDPPLAVAQPYDAPNFGQFLSLDALGVY